MAKRPLILAFVEESASAQQLASWLVELGSYDYRLVCYDRPDLKIAKLVRQTLEHFNLNMPGGQMVSKLDVVVNAKLAQQGVGDYFQGWSQRGFSPVILLTNDCSVRGQSISRAAERLGHPRFLVQQGWLDFDYSGSELRGAARNNANWGSTRPETIGTYGDKRKYHCLDREYAHSSTSVFVTGYAGALPDLQESKLHTNLEPKIDFQNAYVLLIDQAWVEHGVMTLEQYFSHISKTCEYLLRACQSVTVLMHPSAQTRTINYVKSLNVGISVGGANAANDFFQVSDNKAMGVTFYSTAFLDMMSRGIDVVPIDSSRIGVQLPHLDIFSAGRIDHEKSLLENTAVGSIASINTGRPAADFASYIEPFNIEAFEAALVSTIRYARDFSWATRITSQTPKASKNWGHLHVVSGNALLRTGVYATISAVLPKLAQRFESVTIHAGGMSVPRWNGLSGNDVVILNGIGSLDLLPRPRIEELYWHSKRGGRVVFFPHEDQWALKNATVQHAGRFLYFCIKLLPRLTIWTVSQRQQKLFATLGAQNFDFVGEGNLSANQILGLRRNSSRSLSHVNRVLGVGTLQRRKGVDIFADTADAASVARLGWTFSWLGAPTSEVVAKSPNVTYLGLSDHPSTIAQIGSSDIIFLPSRDDPKPLVVAESLAIGVPVVIGPNNGWAPWVIKHGGGVVAPSYSAADCLEALKTVANRRRQAPCDVNLLISESATEEVFARMLKSLNGSLPELNVVRYKSVRAWLSVFLFSSSSLFAQRRRLVRHLVSLWANMVRASVRARRVKVP